MPFTRPPLATLRQQALSDLQTRLPGADTTLRRSNLAVTAEVMARGLNGEYGYLDWMVDQLFLSTAETDYLDREGRDYGILRKAATPAVGNAVFVGIAGILVPSGTPLQTSDGLEQFTTQADATMGGGGTVSVAIEATGPGSAGNLLPGAMLLIGVAIAGVNAYASVDSSGLSGGTDTESDDSLRARIQARKRQTPQGGAWYDYVAWAKTVPATTRVWVYPLARGAGTLDVVFVCDGRTSIIPLTADITATQAAIDAVRPVTAQVQACAPIADATAIGITGISDTPTQTAILASLASLFATATPGAALYGDGVTTAAPGGVLDLEQISGAIRDAAGGQLFDLTAPVADIASAARHIATLGAVTFS